MLATTTTPLAREAKPICQKKTHETKLSPFNSRPVRPPAPARFWLIDAAWADGKCVKIFCARVTHAIWRFLPEKFTLTSFIKLCLFFSVVPLEWHSNILRFLLWFEIYWFSVPCTRTQFSILVYLVLCDLIQMKYLVWAKGSSPGV